jgi:hypothetical protein
MFFSYICELTLSLKRNSHFSMAALLLLPSVVWRLSVTGICGLKIVCIFKTCGVSTTDIEQCHWQNQFTKIFLTVISSKSAFMGEPMIQMSL